jgi:glycosyltransferase involved in cell wall biosynthesis
MARPGTSDRPVEDGPLVSIVTPVFNGADYLDECVRSVLAQTYENWDYTIVDNASTDATPDIAGAFAAQDSRIRHVRFDEFVSATANHNRAYRAISAESEFCKIVQGDDWLYPECLARMVEAAAASNNIGIVSSYLLRESRVDLHGLSYTTTLAPGRDILRATLLGHFNVTGSPTATLLRSAYVREREPFWQEGFRHEDTEAMLWMLSRHDFAFVHQVLSFARQQSGSRFAWSENMNSQGAEDIVFLLRYGRCIANGEQVLDDTEYRKRLRARLKAYVWWHVRQSPRLSRLRDPEFFELHRLKRSQILAEANGDPEVVAAMSAVGALLFREAVRARGRTTRTSG